MASVKWLNWPVAWRVDLVPLAFEFRLGHRDSRGCESSDDRDFASHVVDGGPITGGQAVGIDRIT